MKTLLQLYSARNFQPWERVVETTAKAGYDGIEPFAAVFEDAAGFKALTEASGLSLPSAHVPLQMLEEMPDTAFAVARTFGMKLIVVPWLPEEARPTTRAAAGDLAGRLADLCQGARQNGFELAYHNHDFEFVPLDDGSLLLDILMETVPDLMWESDIGWLVRAGQDPIAWLDRYADRIVAVHLKDYDGADSEGGWTDLGHGPTDYAPIFARLSRLPKLRYCIAEHDDPSDFKRFATRWMESYKVFAEQAGLNAR